MKIKKVFIFVFLTVLSVLIFSKTVLAADNTITIWVGSESKTFYLDELNNGYKAYYKETTGEDFPYSFDVVGVDTGSAADTYLKDPEAGADIFTVAHDNLGKLLDGAGTIDPITNQALIDQMDVQNTDAFMNAVYLQGGDGATNYYAVPYIAQALVLYYKESLFPDKTKLETWEGIMDVAKTNNAMATSFNGTDGFNYSLFLLAQPKSQDAKAAFGASGTLKIYKNGSQTNCFNWGDDQIAIQKYAQRFTLDRNGRNGLLVTSDGYGTELKTGAAITMVGGAWVKGQIISSLGTDWNVTSLPSFTLKEEDAYGTAVAGMEFWSGTFADCKCFVKKKGSAYAQYLDDILKYLSSDEVQLKSYNECDNLPSSKNVVLPENPDDPKKYALAAAQKASAEHGIPQPFGVKAKYNQYYYSAGAPAMYEAISCNTAGAYDSDLRIKRKLQEACYIWTHGKAAPTDESAATAKNPTLNTWLTDLGYEVEIDPRDVETKKKGCGSSVATGSAVLVTTLSFIAIALIAMKLTKKKQY